ncbi:tandem-95 repeat protein [Parachitinimonas caeni]|uniref:Ig-like domain-containing protein n=1 Tax=Parachitinimonas caeni TaxID=3031301 RepID=A0ABT7E5Z2_9NEIS|nr:Ig-like domain-containing protein [Parachitinimonas caeni]MDK2126880.1 Ig-like domain-containing protein [Parachitinimonas caeni]
MSYLQYESSDPSIVVIDSAGRLKALRPGQTMITVKAKGISAFNVVTVTSTPEPLLADRWWNELDLYPPSFNLAEGTGQRQIDVHTFAREGLGDDLMRGSTGTRYLISDPEIASVTPDGLVQAKRVGSTTITVINGGRQGKVRLQVQPTVQGPIQVSAAEGGVITDAAGNTLTIGADALPKDIRASIRQIAIDSLSTPLPAPGVLEVLSAVEVDVSDAEAKVPLQLALKVSGPIDPQTGAPTQLPPGTKVMFWREGFITDTDGSLHRTWWLVDDGEVGADGIARTASPPYHGIRIGGNFLCTKSVVEDKKTGELQLSGKAIDWKAVWSNLAHVSLDISHMRSLGHAGAAMLLSAQNDFVAVYYGIAGAYKVNVPIEGLVSKNPALQFPAVPRPDGDVTPQITRFNFDPSTRKITLTGKNFLPPGQAATTGGVSVWLAPRGAQLESPSVAGANSKRGLVWQGYEAKLSNTSGTDDQVLEFVLNEDVALSQHVIFVRRSVLAMDGQGRLVEGMTIDSPAIEAWTAGVPTTVVTTKDSIEIFAPKDKATSSNSAPIALLGEITKNERGYPLDLGRHGTTNVAFSQDGTLAFVAGATRQIYMVDTLTRKVTYTLQLENIDEGRITSLIRGDDWLYVTLAAHEGRPGSVVRINIDPNRGTFLKHQQRLASQLEEKPDNYLGMAINAGSYLAITAQSGKVHIIDLNQINADGYIDPRGKLTVTSDQYSREQRGKAPWFVTSGPQDGEFIVSNKFDASNGLGVIRVKTDPSGQINRVTTSDAESLKLLPHIDDKILKEIEDQPQNHRFKHFRQNILTSAGTVLASYRGQEFALVADYNFWFLDPTAPRDGSVPNSQIGGKIGIVMNPFGRGGKPPVYLGATTPVAGSAFEKLALGEDGTLYATVWNYQPNYDIQADLMSYSLFTWNASALIEGAINANKSENLAKLREIGIIEPSLMPIDRNYVFDGTTGSFGTQISRMTPARYDGAIADQRFNGVHGVASYRPTTAMVALEKINVAPPTISRAEPSKVPNPLPVRTQAEILNQEGNMVKQMLMEAMDTLLADGYLGRHDERVMQYRAGQINYDQLTRENYRDVLLNGFGVAISFSRSPRVGWSVSRILIDRGMNAVQAAEIDAMLQVGHQMIDEMAERDGSSNRLSLTSMLEVAASKLPGPAQTILDGIRDLIEPEQDQRKLRHDAGQPGKAISLDETQGNARNVSPLDGIPRAVQGQSELKINGIKVFDTPAPRSMTLSQASVWYREHIARIEQLVAPRFKEDPYLAARQAWQLRHVILQEAANALLIPEQGGLLKQKHPIPSFEEYRLKLGDQLSGSPFFRALIQDLARCTDPPLRHEADACFAAGTPVWTDKGLVPIQDIQVGDRVLSRSDVTGEQTYKRVVKTFKSAEEKQVCVMKLYDKNEWDLAGLEDRYMDTNTYDYLLLTPNHPLMDKSKGWMPARSLRDSNEIIRQSTELSIVSEVMPVYLTENEDIIWYPGSLHNEDGGLMYLTENGIQPDPDIHHFTGNDFVDWSSGEGRYTCTVYNFEVEEFHSYFVGKHGIWVHNADCNPDTVESLDDARLNGILPPNSPSAFFLKDSALKTAQIHHSGMVLVKEDNGAVKLMDEDAPDEEKNPGEFHWVTFQKGTEGVKVDPVDGKFIAQTYLYDNPFPKGSDFIRSGDGRALMPDGSWSLTTIDAKAGVTNTVKNMGRDPREADKYVRYITRTSAALRTNAEFSHVIEFEVPYAMNLSLSFLKRELIQNNQLNPKWASFAGTTDWFAGRVVDHGIPKILAEKPAQLYFTVRPKGAAGVLADELTSLEIVRNTDGTLEVKEFKVDKSQVLKPAISAANPRRDAALFMKYYEDTIAPPRKPLLVTEEGSVQHLDPLTQVQLDQLLPTARQYWLDAGVSPALLDQIRFSIDDLPKGMAGNSEGRQIRLDTWGAGWGWFVDSSPGEQSEFLPTDHPSEFRALGGSAAANRLDLLSVLIHELGHVLGLEHNGSDDHAMSEIIEPGIRRLPDAADVDALQAKGFGLQLPIHSGTPATAGPALINRPDPAPLQPASPAAGWQTRGNANLDAQGGITLAEGSTGHGQASQRLEIGANDRYISLVVAAQNLLANTAGPADAFEVALLNANTGASLVGSTGMANSDALLNIQTGGAEKLASGVRKQLNGDGSVTYFIDLKHGVGGDLAGTPALLSFDLIGFGGEQSHVAIRDIQLVKDVLAFDDAASTDEDSVLELKPLANDLGADASARFELVSQPAHGSVVVNADGSLRYQPAADWSGTETIQYRYTVDGSTSNIATITLTVRPVNDAPLGADSQGSVVAGQPFSFHPLTGAKDVDGDDLFARLDTGPAHGQVSRHADGGWSYVADRRYSGPDQFTYRLSDGQTESAPVTVRLTVLPANTAPTARDGVLSLQEDGTVRIDLAALGSDAEADKLSGRITTQPQHGTLTVQPDGSWLYTPAANYAGEDAIRFILNDGQLDSAEAVLKLIVTPANDAPVLQDQAVTLAEDSVATIAALATATDIEGDRLTAKLVGQPQHGTVVVNADGTFRYTPAANYFGEDHFSYVVNDGLVDSNVATVKLTITPVNDAPTLNDQAVTLTEDGSATLAAFATASDVDGDPLTAKLISQPQHGTVSLNADGTFRYTPAANYYGSDSFRYIVNDGQADSNVATVTLTITPVNDAPVAQDARLTLTEDSQLALDLRQFGRDVDSPTLTPVLISGPYHGQLVARPEGGFTYIPAANFHGTDSVRFTLGDGALQSNEATLSLVVTPVNDAPTLTDQALTLVEDGSATVAAFATASDVDGDMLTAKLISQPQHGTVVVNADGTFRYTPAANYFGADSFSYVVNDGQADSNVATVRLIITPVNDAPVARDGAAGLVEGQSIRLDLRALGFDVEGSALSAVLVSQPRHGTLQRQADGSYLYTANARVAEGLDEFSFALSDGALQSNSARFRLTISPSNTAPTARDSQVQGLEDQSLVIRWSDFAISDSEGDALQIHVDSLPAEGTLYRRLANGTWALVQVGERLSRADIEGDRLIFNPVVQASGGPGYAGSSLGNRQAHYARFGFRASDGRSVSQPAQVTIDITPVADAPSLQLEALVSQQRELFRTSWESVAPAQGQSSLVRQRELEGWRLITEGDGLRGGLDGFEIWSTGSRMSNAANQSQSVQANTGKGRNWLELNDAAGSQYQTLGIERQIETRAGARYDLSFDLAGRLGYRSDLTRIAVYLDEQRIASFDASSGLDQLDWQAVSCRFTGSGRPQTLRIVTDGNPRDPAGRGMQIDDLRLTETVMQPRERTLFRSGFEGAANTDRQSTLLSQSSFDGWNLVTQGDRLRGGQNGFEIWHSGDRMRNAWGREQAVQASREGGQSWLELNDAAGSQYQTLGIERTVQTEAGARYQLNFDLAGRLGYGSGTTRIGVYVDGQRIASFDQTSGLDSLSWQAVSCGFIGQGGTQTLRLVSESTHPQPDGRGMMLDNVSLTEALPLNQGQAGSAIRLQGIQAGLTDTDGSEALQLQLAGLPVGTVVSDGQRKQTISSQQRLLDLTGWNTQTLALIPPLSFSGPLSLQLTATAIEAANGSRASVSQELSLWVDPAPIRSNPHVDCYPAWQPDDEPVRYRAGEFHPDVREIYGLTIPGRPDVGAWWQGVEQSISAQIEQQVMAWWERKDRG